MSIKHKLDIRKGIVVPGSRPKPIQHIDKNKEPAKVAQQSSLSNQELLAAAQAIGEAIAQKIIEAQLSAGQIAVTASSVTTPVQPLTPIVEIDESIIDVGLGDIEELKTGEGSATLAKAETHQDDSMKSSLNRLRKLKKDK
jgi:hypothetical protein